MILSDWLTSLKSRLALPRVSRRTSARRRRHGSALEALESRVMLTVQVQFNYDFDTTGWFSDPTLGQTRRDVLDQAAEDITERLNDTLDAILSPTGTNTWTADFDHPSTGARVQLANLQVPADTLIIFVGSRSLPGGLDGQASTGFSFSGDQAWNNLVQGRGEAGAVGPAAARTDVGPWGGAIAFDSTSTWDLTPRTGNFYNVAQHEIGHLLGITLGFTDNTGTYQPTVWENNVSGGNFTGTAATAAFGGPVPIIHDGNGAHFQNNVMSDGRQVTMARTGDGTAEGFTTLDFAALDDIGWELRQPPVPVPPPRPATVPVTVTITELVQLESPDDGIDDDGDYYIRVFINGVMHQDTEEQSPDDDNEPINPGWSFMQDVPSSLASVPVTIQIFDSDGVLNFEDNEMDISAAAGHLGITLSLNLIDGRWEGGPSFPFFYPTNESQGNGEGDGLIKIKFDLDVPSRVASGLVVAADGSLTVQGDQFTPNLNDDITFDQSASGGLKVTLNGHVMEYAPGAITRIVVNTGSGSNTVTMLASFPEIPITINGAGTDRLTFGPGLPTPTYSPDSTGLPGYGTLNLGGAMISFNGLEYVDGVTPAVTGVQFTSVSIDENGVATVTGTFTDPGSYATHSLAINWGDGTIDPLSRLVLGERSFTATRRYLDDNPTGTPSDNFTITATIADNDNLTASGTTSVTVNNVRPQLQNVLVSSVIDENGTVTLSGEIMDPGTQDIFTLIVNWGEGALQTFSYAAGVTNFSETHQYLDDNPTATLQDNYTISLTLADDDTGQSTATVTTLVKNVAPVLSAFHAGASSDDKAREGELITATGSFTDVGTLDTHTAVIDWGDGTTSAAVVSELGGAGTFTGTHTYQFGGIYNVKVILTDDDTAQVVSVDTVFITGAGLHDVDGKLVLQVVGTNEADQVTINQQGNGTVRVHADFLDDPGGMRTFSLAGIDYIEVALCGGDDHAVVSSAASVPAIVDGGAGDDDLKGGGSGVVLIGGAGNDRLLSGSGRSILIGSAGSDHLVGGSSDDILIGGSTLYDSGQDTDKLANDAALIRLLEEWLASDPFAARKARIEAGVDGLFLRRGDSIFDDGEKDVFVGGSGFNWLSLFDLDEAHGDGHQQ